MFNIGQENRDWEVSTASPNSSYFQSPVGAKNLKNMFTAPKNHLIDTLGVERILFTLFWWFVRRCPLYPNVKMSDER